MVIIIMIIIVSIIAGHCVSSCVMTLLQRRSDFNWDNTVQKVAPPKGSVAGARVTITPGAAVLVSPLTWNQNLIAS